MSLRSHAACSVSIVSVTFLDVQTYLLKLARSGEDGEKIFLLLESGTRFHATEACQSQPHPSVYLSTTSHCRNLQHVDHLITMLNAVYVGIWRPSSHNMWYHEESVPSRTRLQDTDMQTPANKRPPACECQQEMP